MRLVLLILIIGALINCNGDKQPVEKQAEVAQPKMPEQGCVVELQSKLVSQRQVSPIQNLIEDKISRGYENQCTVEFDLVVDGVSYHLKETEIGLYQMPVICYEAKERARTMLLQDLGGEFKSESLTLCRQVDQ